MQVSALEKKKVRLYDVSEEYEVLERVGKGTYGTVFKARSRTDKKNYAIKKLENNDPKLQVEGFPVTALRGTSFCYCRNYVTQTYEPSKYYRIKRNSVI